MSLLIIPTWSGSTPLAGRHLVDGPRPLGPTRRICRAETTRAGALPNARPNRHSPDGGYTARSSVAPLDCGRPRHMVRVDAASTTHPPHPSRMRACGRPTCFRQPTCPFGSDLGFAALVVRSDDGY